MSVNKPKLHRLVETTNVPAFTSNIKRLFREILTNPNCQYLEKSLLLSFNLLHRVSERAAQINDPELNALMCCLALYRVADESDPDYDPQAAAAIIQTASKRVWVDEEL